MRTDMPGVKRDCNRWHARVSLCGRWIYLGSFSSDWYACRARDRAEAAKRQGKLTCCQTAAEVRAVVFCGSSPN